MRLRCDGGLLIVNADDWGRDRRTTESTLVCIKHGTVSSASAMVFMEDSERAACLAQEQNVDTGLHLNFTTPFTARNCSAAIKNHQERVGGYLRLHSFARAIYNPLLTSSFEYLVFAQRDNYERIYGMQPERFDGHHHMHLAANVLLQRLIPQGAILRPHFAYQRGEKLRNKFFRKAAAQMLASRYRTVDSLYSLPPLYPTERLKNIIAAARDQLVELETHPVNPDEYRFLIGGEMTRLANGCHIATGFAKATSGSSTNHSTA